MAVKQSCFFRWQGKSAWNYKILDGNRRKEECLVFKHKSVIMSEITVKAESFKLVKEQTGL